MNSTNVGTELAKISNLETSTTGITYDNADGKDKTTIDNNVTISAGKNLVLNSTNVGTEINKISTLQTSTTGITYNDTGSVDLTTIDNNVTISSGKNLLLGSTNVYTQLNNIGSLLIATTGITYEGELGTGIVPYLTIIDNNLQISATNELYLDTKGIGSTLTGISYDSASDLTTIDNDILIGLGKRLYFATGSGTDINVNEILSEITHDSTTDTTVINKLRVTNPMESLATHRSRFFYNPNSASNNTWGGNNYPDTITSSQYIGSTTSEGTTTSPEIYYDTGGKIRFASTGTYKVMCHMNVDCITMPSGDRTVFGAYVSTNGSSTKFRNISGTNAGVWGVCYLRRSKTTTNGLMTWTGSFDISDYISVTSTNDYVTINTRMYFNADSNLNFTNTSSDSNYDVWCYVEVEKISSTTSLFTPMPIP